VFGSSLCPTLDTTHPDRGISFCRPFDALTNLEVLKLSDTHASGAHLETNRYFAASNALTALMVHNHCTEVVTRNWLLDLNQELTVALMHVDEQRVEVCISQLQHSPCFCCIVLARRNNNKTLAGTW